VSTTATSANAVTRLAKTSLRRCPRRSRRRSKSHPMTAQPLVFVVDRLAYAAKDLAIFRPLLLPAYLSRPSARSCPGCAFFLHHLPYITSSPAYLPREARLDPSLLALRVVHGASVARPFQFPGLIPRGFALCCRPGSRRSGRRLMEWAVRSVNPLRYVPSLAPFVSCCWPADSLRPFDERLQEAAQPITGLLV
jgi:hypothetical protein